MIKKRKEKIIFGNRRNPHTDTQLILSYTLYYYKINADNICIIIK